MENTTIKMYIAEIFGNVPKYLGYFAGGIYAVREATTDTVICIRVVDESKDAFQLEILRSAEIINEVIE